MIPENWQKAAKENQKAYKRVLEKGNYNKMLKALPELHEEVFSKIDCLQCANCCKNYSPRFKNPDIKRIAKVLKMKEGDFVATYLRLDEDNDYVVKQSPCPFLQKIIPAIFTMTAQAIAAGILIQMKMCCWTGCSLH